MADAGDPSLTSTAQGRLPVDGRLVRLRDVALADAEMLDRWHAEREPGSFNDLGQPNRPTPRDVLAGGPLRDEHRGTLIVERLDDGTPVGYLSWHVRYYGPNRQSACFNIGIELLPAVRGRGYGSDAQRLLAEWLLGASRVNRVEASTDVVNLAEQRSLEKAGFIREGTMRRAQLRGDAYHDLVYYSRLRDD